MALTRTDVEHLATLARLEISGREIAQYADSLSGILAFVEQLNAAATEGVEPMAHPLDLIQRLRADEITEHDQRERFQRGAPAVADGLYLVPKVID